MVQSLITQQYYFVLKLFAALGCGLVAGVFFAFSTFVMSALTRLQAAQGIAAMQSINITAINPPFMVALFGTAAACLLLAVSSLFNWHQPGAAYLTNFFILWFYCRASYNSPSAFCRLL